MELFNQIIKFVDVNLIYCLIPMILTLVLIQLFFKDRFRTKKALNVIRWLIISYAIITIINFLIGLTNSSDELELINRATGPYKLAYLLMFMCATILPLTLIKKTLASKNFYLLLVAILMKNGWYLERFIIISTSFHRDYLPEGEPTSWFLSETILLILLQGFTISILILTTIELIERKRVHNKL